jgi:threonine 3-dehydrogenase
MTSKTMLAVLKETPQAGVVIKNIDIPTPKQDEVLVKVKYASICGTDINIYDWNTWAQGHITPPAVIGHELVGEVVEINGTPENDLAVGDMVSSETHIFCLNCFQCQIGNKHICENMELFGIGRDGSFAEYTTIPLKTTWKNDLRIPVESMSVQEPLGNAVNVVTKANVKDKKVLVMGLGPTGLCAGMVAKAYGAREVVGINRREYRRELAMQVGFDRTLEELPESEYGTFDAVLEMSGNRVGIQVALDAARIAGKIIAFGIPKDKIDIDWGKYMINKELSIDSVFGRMIWDTWNDTTELLVSGKVDLRKIITHRFKLSEFEKAMEVMKSGECGKVLLIP